MEIGFFAIMVLMIITEDRAPGTAR